MHYLGMDSGAAGSPDTVVQWFASKNGAKNGRMASTFLPPEENAKVARRATTVRLSPDEHADIEYIAKLWNDYDKAKKTRRSRKWKASSVVEMLVRVGIEGFWRQVGQVADFGGVRPDSVELRDKLARLMVAQAEKESKEASKKPKK